MKVFAYPLLASCLLMVFCVPFAAAQRPDREGCKDDPLISRYPGSSLNGCFEKDFDEFNLMLGKNNEAGKFSKSLPLEGKIAGFTYQAPDGRSTLEVFRNYQQALSRGGFQTLFNCSKDDCIEGRFNMPLMYASGEWEQWGGGNPRFIAAKLPRPQGDVYAAVMVVGDPPYVTEYLVEVKPMETGLITVNAAGLEAGLTQAGHVEVPGIFFDFNKSELKPESKPALDEVAKMMKERTAVKVWVVGHTDSVGTVEANQKLSEARAAAVAKALVANYGISAARLKGYGVGPLAPVASNASDDGRAKNRRVELVEQ
jgi:OmpA-OmpF porin, OOP family